MALPRISIVIPVLNEASTIAGVLAAAQAGVELEVIVVDGGSSDGTLQQVQGSGVRLLQTSAGRARQMNQGAAIATGGILLFLHGDTRLPIGFDQQVRQTLAKSGVIAGAFQLKIDCPTPGLRKIEHLVNWRSHLLQMPYGDQALFLKTETFQKLGGFPDLPIMEDFELVRQLGRLGRIAIVPLSVTTSGRRWEKLGLVKTTLINQLMIVGYVLGVSPTRLATWYRHGRTN
ncbi:glycosyltransferase [Leptolyngbya sp. 'hensonii']|uniref:TIGR04283 family arsenosugar biosynthesis glycosyltransferase n=1 Tax=Leptolyngbya sp. 'hensonii' TaxID=1922337 RepID=UPI00094FC572|nr:TIGR04283 family arsenosugar biosynthesis glycosyltransferase [Leptolyngbya sp. 'hensonii']OLP18310.1 glycosyltransferase [Leptolyngbya sp. 'hensonii']